MGNTESSRDEIQQELGAKIYEVAEKGYPDIADKIAGMVLEADHKELQDLLDNHELLEDRIHTAARVLNEGDPKAESPPDIQTLGDRVFGTVQQLYPAIAENVTGMLVEMDEEELYRLLNDKDALIQHIHTAAHVLMETRLQERSTSAKNNIEDTKIKENSTASSNSPSDEEQKCHIGEEIYDKIAQDYPNQADKITGMLLEMDLENLQEINKNSELLHEKVEEALLALGDIKPEEKGNDISKQAAVKASMVAEITPGKPPVFNQTEIENRISGYCEEKQKELIGEMIYENVSKLYPKHADHITGMVMEMDLENLLALLQDAEFYEERINEAAQVLGCPERRLLAKAPVLRELDDTQKSQLLTPDLRTKEELIKELRKKLSIIYPISEINQITQMLYCLENVSLVKLLSSQDDLKTRVEEINKEHEGRSSALGGIPVVNGDSSGLTKEEIYELISNKISIIYPGDAEQLIGLLKDLDHESLISCAQSDDALRSYVEKAKAAVHDGSRVSAFGTEFF